MLQYVTAFTYIHTYINEFITRNTVKQSSNQRRGHSFNYALQKTFNT